MPRFQALVVAAAIGGCGDSPSAPQVVFDMQPTAASNDPNPVFAFHDSEGSELGFFCTREAGPRLPCSSPVTFKVTEGPHQFVVSTGVGSSDSSAECNWTTDLTAPDTSIVVGPPAVDNSPSETISFSSSESTNTFECALDGTNFVACISPATLTPSEGDHVFVVRAVDAAGNVDPTPAELAWTLDAVGPDTQITNGPVEGSTTARSTTFTFASTADAIAFQCSVDSDQFAPCASPHVLQEGTGAHTLKVRAVDGHGVVDPSPATRSWNVDVVAPTTVLATHPTNPTNANVATFTFSSPDSTATFQCLLALDDSEWVSCTSPLTTPALADGDQFFDVRAVDPVGNIGPDVGFVWFVDTTGPDVVFTDGGTVDFDHATFHFTSNGDAVRFECRVDVDEFEDCSTRTFTTRSLAISHYTFEVRAFDALGNFGVGLLQFEIPII